MLVGERERDGARAGADVENPRLLAARNQRERSVDEDLRLGSRNQCPPVDRQCEVAKAPLAEHVLQWLPPSPPSHELTRALQLEGVQRAVERHVELDPLEARRA